MKKANRTGLTSVFSVLIFAGGILFSPGFAAAQMAQGPDAEVCKNCHEDKYQSFLAHRHGTKADPRTPAARGGCVVCHGDGTEHVKAGGGRGVGGIKDPSPKEMSSEDINKLCLGCHQADPNRMHWQQSVHAGRGLACTSCHEIHETDKVREKLTQPEVCFTCHKDKRVQVHKPSRHPILEGKVVCGDCHNPHGANYRQLVKDSVNETCFQCHMEKRGPFLYSHQPVTEDCTICHQPHGSTISPMLKSRPPFLCQDCHSTAGHPGQPASLPTTNLTSATRQGTVGRGCVNCHTTIHGSNSTINRSRARRFVR